MKSELFEQSNLEVQSQQRFGLQNAQMLRVALGPDVLLRGLFPAPGDEAGGADVHRAH